jgi:hypothetical protein
MHVGCVVSVLRRQTGSIATVFWFTLAASEKAVPVDPLELATDWK